MRWDNLEHDDERSIQDKAYDLLGDMILERETAALVRKTDEQQAAGGSPEMEDFFARQDKANLEKIDAYYRKQHRRKILTHTLPRIGRVAAIVVAVLSLAGGVAVATSHTFRVHVMQLLVNIEEEYTEVSLVEDEDSSFDVPSEWRGSCYPAYIPVNFTLGSIVSLPMTSVVEFTDVSSEKTKLSFSEFDAHGATNIDTEDALISGVTINGTLGYLVEKEEKLIVFWTNGRSYFVLRVQNLDKNEAIKVAESVQKI